MTASLDDGSDAVGDAVAPAERVGLGGVPSPGPYFLGSLSTPPATISWRAGVAKRHASQRGLGRELPPAPPGGSAERLSRPASEGKWQRTRGVTGEGLGVAVRAAVGAAGAGVELDDEAVAPAVFVSRARLNIAHERGRRLRAHHASAAAKDRGAHPPLDARLHEQVLHPLRAQPVLGDQVVAPPAAREPDLDAPLVPRLPAPRGEVEILLLVARRRAFHRRAR